jgi:hypothetical protein
MDPLTEFGKLVEQLALDGIRLQQIWNQAYAIEIEQFAELLADHPAAAQWMLSLAPARMAFTDFQVELAVRIEAGTEAKFDLGCLPINLQYSRRFQTAAESTSRIRITVAQSPLPPLTNLP